MKTMFPQGVEGCDLGCYPACEGYSKQGCLMFGDKKPFLFIKCLCLGKGLLMFQLDKNVVPTGVWEKNSTVIIGKKFGAPEYMDEPLH